MKRISTVVFDLDGTLLDSLQDLADSTNHVLAQFGYPVHTLDDIRRFVGNGVKVLMERALPDNLSPLEFEKVFSEFKAYYVDHCIVKTKPYQGIYELLEKLKERHYKVAIVSNKLQSGVDELYVRFFKDLVQVAVGECPEIKRKPSPDMVNKALQILGSTSDEAVYIGDSDVDIATARNSGLPCISVLWGFRDREFLIENGATHLVSSPDEILSLLDGNLLNQSSNE